MICCSSRRRSGIINKHWIWSHRWAAFFCRGMMWQNPPPPPPKKSFVSRWKESQKRQKRVSSSSRYLHHESLNWMIEKKRRSRRRGAFSAVISALQNGSLARKMIMRRDGWRRGSVWKLRHLSWNLSVLWRSSRVRLQRFSGNCLLSCFNTVEQRKCDCLISWWGCAKKGFVDNHGHSSALNTAEVTPFNSPLVTGCPLSVLPGKAKAKAELWSSEHVYETSSSMSTSSSRFNDA